MRITPPIRSPRPIRSRPVPVPWSSRLRWGLLFASLAGGLLYLTWSVVAVVVASAVLAYLLNPLVTRLEDRGFSRNTGAAMLAAGSMFAAVLLITLVVPTFVSQVQELSVNLVPYVENLHGKVGPVRSYLKSKFGLVIPVDLRELATVAPQYVQKLSPDVRDGLTHFLQLVASGGLGFVSKAIQVALVIPFTWFLLVDWPHLMSRLRAMVPPRWHGDLQEITSEIDARIFAFVKGQILVCTLLGFLYTGGLLLVGIDLAATVGMLSGFLFLVPYLGTVVGIVLSCSLALLKFGPDWHILACLATFGISQAIEGTLLTPLLVGGRVGLHPMVVIVALMTGGDLLGIWGLLLAVPLTAALAVIGERLLLRYQKSELYRSI